LNVSKVQQLLLTLVGLVAYGLAIGDLLATILAGVTIAELPGMDGGFLSLLAASSATYLAYKRFRMPNPSIPFTRGRRWTLMDFLEIPRSICWS
jgi:hypothetical protein